MQEKVFNIVGQIFNFRIPPLILDEFTSIVLFSLIKLNLFPKFKHFPLGLQIIVFEILDVLFYFGIDVVFFGIVFILRFLAFAYVRLFAIVILLFLLLIFFVFFEKSIFLFFLHKFFYFIFSH